MYMSVVGQVTCCLYYYNHVIELEIRYNNAPSSVLLLKTSLFFQGLLCFHLNFWILFSYFCEKYHGIFLGLR